MRRGKLQHILMFFLIWTKTSKIFFQKKQNIKANLIKKEFCKVLSFFFLWKAVFISHHTRNQIKDNRMLFVYLLVSEHPWSKKVDSCLSLTYLPNLQACILWDVTPLMLSLPICFSSLGLALKKHLLQAAIPINEDISRTLTLVWKSCLNKYM